MEKSNEPELALQISTDIAPDGDLLLLVGPPKIRILVESAFLKHASPVFKAMLGPHFSEGQPSNDGVKEISLPDDDVDAIKIICAVFHLRNDEIPDHLSAACVLRIAVTADKYDCIVPLLLASHHWLDPRNSKDLEGLVNLMTAAYLLDNHAAFAKITLRTMLDYQESYLPFAEEASEFVPWQVFYLLEEKRNRIRKKLDLIISEETFGLSRDCPCGNVAKRSYAYSHLLEREDLLPQSSSYQGLSIKAAMEKAKRMGPLPDPVEEDTSCKESRWHSWADYREGMRKELLSLREETGLCLDCVRSGGNGTDGHCRIRHLVEVNLDERGKVKRVYGP